MLYIRKPISSVALLGYHFKWQMFIKDDWQVARVECVRWLVDPFEDLPIFTPRFRVEYYLECKDIIRTTYELGMEYVLGMYRGYIEL